MNPLEPKSNLAALRSLMSAFTKGSSLRAPAAHRLAFRELGLAIGLKGVMPRVSEMNSASTPLSVLLFPERSRRELTQKACVGWYAGEDGWILEKMANFDAAQ